MLSNVPALLRMLVPHTGKLLLGEDPRWRVVPFHRDLFRPLAV